jgi:hypothetical protein
MTETNPIGPFRPDATGRPLQGEIITNFTWSGKPPLEMLDGLSYVMDRMFQIPGTRMRAGLNTVFMLLPVLGDIIPSMVSVAILLIGLKHYRVPRIVAVRMAFNSLLDAALGWIPILGDLFDLFFKADTRNVRLLQQYAGQEAGPPHSTWPHWVFVIGVLLFFVLLSFLIVMGLMALVHWINHTMFGPLNEGR